ncbi:MAG TPA: hypothetical protein VGP17_15055 [Solirubrobacteraceae bacterium]|nr:hypothetical protein [Solirubrobacteraceae bacterium]
MNRNLGPIGTHDRHDLKQRSAPRWAQIQASVFVLILDRHGVFYSVFDVCIGDAVLARRGMDLHQAIVVRN